MGVTCNKLCVRGTMLDFKAATVNNNGVNYPLTEAINASNPTALDGTEFIKATIDEDWGGKQAVLAATGETPTGNPDVADNSQFLGAIVEQASGRAVFVKESAGSIVNIYVVEANTLAVPVAPSTGVNGTPKSFYDEMTLTFDVAADNTAASTLNAFTLGAKDIKLPDGSDPAAGDITGRITVRYDGTDFILVRTEGNAVAHLKVIGAAPAAPDINTTYLGNNIKASGNITGGGGVNSAHNVSSVGLAANVFTVNLATAMATVSYSPVATPHIAGDVNAAVALVNASSFEVRTFNTAGALSPSAFLFIVTGG